MSQVPVVAQFDVDPAHAGEALATRCAERLVRAQPGLIEKDAFADLRTESLDDFPTLHLDDLSEIRLIDRFYDSTFLEDRARLRAGDGDLVSSCTPRDPGFEGYCEGTLGLGAVTWLHPRPRGNPLCVAASSWTDRETRNELVRAIRRDGLRYVHPFMGSFPVWAVASLLRRASRCPLHVIAPPPELTRLANDKLWFADVVRRLFGEKALPETVEAGNYATLAQVVCDLAPRSRSIVVKVPDSAGGSGNLVLPTRRLRHRPVGRVRMKLKKLLRELPWVPGEMLLVSSWEADVLCAPSAQLWLPPESGGPPVVEGLFLQSVGGSHGKFVGSRPARLPVDLQQGIVERSWQIGRLLQRLGYVGRCSFDLILVGRSLGTCRIEFIECNGRWGGTSTPMTLVNRTSGNWLHRPYAARKCRVEGLSDLCFADLLEHFDDQLFDRRTGRGELLFYDPGRMGVASGIDVVAFAEDWDDAFRRASEEVPERLRELVRSRRRGVRGPKAGVR